MLLRQLSSSQPLLEQPCQSLEIPPWAPTTHKAFLHFMHTHVGKLRRKAMAEAGAAEGARPGSGPTGTFKSGNSPTPNHIRPSATQNSVREHENFSLLAHFPEEVLEVPDSPEAQHPDPLVPARLTTSSLRAPNGYYLRTKLHIPFPPVMHCAGDPQVPMRPGESPQKSLATPIDTTGTLFRKNSGGSSRATQIFV